MRWLRRGCAVVGLLAASAAYPCASAPPQGRTVSIDAEQAVIVWDEAAHREHFIRRASFSGDAEAFGFLVPTPAVPELKEADDHLFDALADLTRPQVVTEDKWVPGSLFLLSRSPMRDALVAAGPVRVLDQVQVAGYDATVLEADDASALAQWLKERGFEARASLTEWLTPYVEKKWKLTAFKVAKGTAAQPGVRTGTVRMSFDAERPYFPYREPADQREGPARPRQLRVYFVAPWRAEATIGSGSTAFPGKTYWAAPFPGLTLPVPAPAGSWLTVFDDFSSPRPGLDELFFSREGSQERVVPPPVHDVHEQVLPVEGLCCVVVLFVGGYGVWALARRRRQRPA